MNTSALTALSETLVHLQGRTPPSGNGLITNHINVLFPRPAAKVFEEKTLSRLIDASMGSANPGIVIEGVVALSQPNVIGCRADLCDFEAFLRGNACTLWE
jgi:hypothetical protein